MFRRDSFPETAYQICSKHRMDQQEQGVLTVKGNIEEREVISSLQLRFSISLMI